MKQSNSNPISQNIKKYRLLNKLTQEQLAELLDLDTQYYSQLERGERNFTIEKITRLCSIFNVGIENIIEIEPISEDNTMDLVNVISTKMTSLSRSQLIILQKFIDEILPLVN